MKKILKQSFFNRPTLDVAQDLLGKYIVHKEQNKARAFMITDVESYDGLEDLASHASKGRTQRTEIMFGEAGRFYIYLVYGIHYLLNVVTGPREYPAAILIRGVEETSGPGRVSKLLSIDKRFNNKKADPLNGLWFEDRGVKVNQKQIKKSARIGVHYAGPLWAKKEFRFTLPN